MKTRFLFAAAILAVMSFFSCKKDNPAPGNPTPGNPAPGNPVVEKRLKKLTKTEGGKVTVYNLTYNAAGKPVSYRNADNSAYVLFTYDAAGNLTGIEEKEEDFLNFYVYTYANNIPVSGIFESWDISGGLPGTLVEDDQLSYTVTNNQVSKIKLTSPGGPEWNFNFTYTNGNLTGVNTDGVIVYIVEFTYGNKKPIYPKVTNYILDQAGFSLLFAANHEILKAVYDFPGTTHDYTTNNIYTYDSNGYVLTSTDGITQQVFEYE